MATKIQDINSSAIAAFAREHGIGEMELEASSDEIAIYSYPLPAYLPAIILGRVAVTNGDPIWEEENPEAFGELLAE